MTKTITKTIILMRQLVKCYLENRPVRQNEKELKPIWSPSDFIINGKFKGRR